MAGRLLFFVLLNYSVLYYPNDHFLHLYKTKIVLLLKDEIWHLGQNFPLQSAMQMPSPQSRFQLPFCIHFMHKTSTDVYGSSMHGLHSDNTEQARGKNITLIYLECLGPKSGQRLKSCW